ncbi:thiamine pyrophosphokinase [Loktanella sp. 5RATIMAR09]|uniref:thiamine diphosphokinase n=1 Tax=Loktanella sp. 5RATIMAR09 TaxID=1225655 RepID=UPI0006EB65DA|nr:thiamine diphosphokinase [Loktanella sp. 5RATIMAR09]KQI71280.1 thiamine pyrophosphokinase [Loktanella sp. 5RATIMAR09]
MPNKPIVSSDTAICLVGGAPIAEDTIAAVFTFVNSYVGVDGGADHLLAADVTPAAVIGDLDSLSDKARATFARQLNHIAEQSTTDFEKALSRVSAPVVLGVGFTGGRLDHALSVLNVLARYVEQAVLLVDAHEVSFVAPVGRVAFTLTRGTRISLMPLGHATVTFSGVRWPFSQTRMTPDGFTSPSNEALGGAVTVETDGPVLVTLPRAHLALAMKAAVRAE